MKTSKEERENIAVLASRLGALEQKESNTEEEDDLVTGIALANLKLLRKVRERDIKMIAKKG